MKRVLIISIGLVTVLLYTGIASADWRPYFSFSVFLPQPVAWVPSPAPVVVYPGYPPLRLLPPALLRESSLGSRLPGEPMDALWMDEGLGSGLLAIWVLNLFGSDSDEDGYKKGVMSNDITPFHF